MDLGKIGQFIAELRKEQHLTQTQLGEKVGVTGKTVSKWEKGICAPNISILNDLSAALRVTTTELLNGTKIPDISKEDILDATTKGFNCYKHIKAKRIQKRLLFFLLGMLIFIRIFLLPFFFQNNYSIYELESADKNYHIKGLLMVTPNNNIFIMNSIENISNDDLFNKKLYAYEYALKAKDINLLQDGNILLYEHQKNDPLISLSDLLSKIRIYKIESNHSKETIFKERLTKNQLKLIITYLDYEMNQKEICIKINLKPIYVTYKNRWILFSNLSKSLY